LHATDPAAVERDDVHQSALPDQFFEGSRHLHLLEAVRHQHRHLQPLQSSLSHDTLVCTAMAPGKVGRMGCLRRPGCSSVARMQVSRTSLLMQLRALGVTRGQVLLVHSSFRALRPVEGGPRGMLEALHEALGPEGTLVMPSWTGEDDFPFDPRTTPASKDLGVLADTLWRLPGARRSAHPFAFAALGPDAESVVGGPM